MILDTFELNISQEFIESGRQHKSRSKKRGGPYSKNEKIKRQNEVYRLHFEYGYSARKISELMNVNRNTINGDITYLYSKILDEHNFLDPEQSIVISIQRLNSLRSGLRETLDKTENFQQRHATEKMIFDIDCKIINIQIKMVESLHRTHKISMNYLNDWLKNHGHDNRYMSFHDTISVSEKAKQKISKIIKEDRKKI